MSERARSWRWTDFALILLVFVAYAPTLTADFLWDDALWLSDSPVTTSADGWLRAWTQGAHFDYYPLTSTVFWIAWRVLGSDAFGYHLLNVLLHAAGAVVLCRLLERLGLRAAWIAAAAWAVHPVNVATVGWIAELKSTLAFPLHALAAFVWIDRERADSPGRRAAATGLHAASLLAKSAGVMLPVGLLLWAAARGRSLRKEAVALLPMFLVSLASGLLTLRFQAEGAIGSAVPTSADPVTRLAAAGNAVWFYAAKALAPVDLAGVYARNELASRSWLGLILVGVTIALLLVARRRAGLVPWAAWSGYVMTLLPILGLVDLYYMRWSPVADHWQYAALPWLVCAVVAGGARVLSRMPAALAKGVGVALILALTALSFQRSLIYRDGGTFWSHILLRDPDSVLAHNELGVHLASRGEVEPARALFERAAALDPRDAFAHSNLGRMLEKAGQHAAAADAYRTAAELEPKLVSARANLGRALAQMGDLDGAIVELRRAADAEPRLVEPNLNLALIFRQRGELDSAQVRFERVIELAPENTSARLEVARIFVTRNDLPGAATALRELLAVDPAHVEARSVLGAIEKEIVRRQTP